jgi:4-phospho-D-threonate 3-dehydrogenase / 4-phospho-D-erythronate 3-dehydrogenase
VGAPLFIGISLGDVTGIGPEVTLKALCAEASIDDTRYLLIGDAAIARLLNQRLKLTLPLVDEVTASPADRFVLAKISTPPLPEHLPQGSAEAALASVSWVREGVRNCLSKKTNALVTAPVNKEAIVRAGVPFVGQTELLSEMAGTERTAMMLLGTDDRGRWLRVALATTHVPLREVATRLTARKIQTAIELSAQACRDLGLARARVGVCGLNPHAGEGGKIGTEELTTIGPAVQWSRSQGVDVIGPVSADALFYYALRGEYDVVVAMYHDQGLAPLKMVAFEHGVNWTLGLPFIRTSPDHGTAYDIAGKGVASPSSMIAALRLARQLGKSRHGG